MSCKTSLHKILDKENWNLEKIEKFLEHNRSSINEKNSSGDTPLIRVLTNDKCSLDIVKLMLNYGADINRGNKHGWTPLIFALMHRRNVEFIELLMGTGDNVNVSAPYGDALICLAFQYYTSKDIIRLLLDAGYIPSVCKWHGSALHCWINRLYHGPLKKEGVLQMLIKKNDDVNAVDRFGQSVLCSVLGKGIQASDLKLLLEAGGVIHCEKHKNPLLCATRHADTEFNADVVQLLLNQGACVNSEVLQCALKGCINETKAIELLLDHLQGVTAKGAKDKMKNTLLHLAVGNPHVKKSVVKLLVKRGVGVNGVNKYRNTALHEVVKSEDGKSSVVKTLLKMGSRVNLGNSSGKTPLHLAMMQLQDADTLKLLLAAGSRFGVTGHSLLKGVIDECDASLDANFNGYWEPMRKRLDCCKLLLKCYFLENPDFNFQLMIQGHQEYEELSGFGANCVREVRKLNLKILDEGRTLREFLSGRSPFQVDAANFGVEVESALFHRLLRIIAENAFPLFLDIIAAKVGRSSMKMNLKKLQVYTYRTDDSRIRQKVVLNLDIVHKIANLLTDDDDLLRFMSAFSKPDSCAGKVTKENICKDKRSGEQRHKRPRLQL